MRGSYNEEFLISKNTHLWHPGPPSPDFVNFFISLVRANLEVPRGYIWVLGRFGDGMIDSPNPLPPGSRRGGVSIS